MLNRIAALVAASLLACAPAAAQLDTRTLPAASPLTGAERMPAVQGSGCTTKTTPCASVAVTPSLVGTFLAPTFQAKDADLDAIAALATTSFGRGLLTQADAAAVRSTIGVTATGADATYAYRANNLSDLGSTSTARTNLGLGSIATQSAAGVAITGGTVTGITDLTVADGGTGASTAAAARSNLGVPALATANTLQVSAGPALPVVKTDGVVEIGQYLDWHASAGANTDYDYRITASGSQLQLSGALLAAGDISRDTQFRLTLNGSNPTIFLDDQDALAYDRAANKFVFSIAGVVVATLDGSGNLRVRGTVTPSVTP